MWKKNRRLDTRNWSTKEMIKMGNGATVWEQSPERAKFE
jgi:hypothetical protein